MEEPRDLIAPEKEERKTRIDYLADVLQKSLFINVRLQGSSTSGWDDVSSRHLGVPYHTKARATSWRPQFARTTSYQGIWPVNYNVN